MYICTVHFDKVLLVNTIIFRPMSVIKYSQRLVDEKAQFVFQNVFN